MIADATAIFRKPVELERSGGRDPAFLSKLAELGQVSTQGGKPNFTAPREVRPRLILAAVPRADQLAALLQNESNPAQDLLRRRNLDPISFPSGSSEESSPTEAESHNRLDAPTLIALLAARREAQTPDEAQSIAESYGVDLELVDQLAAFVNPPSVREDIVRVTDDGETTPVVRSSCAAAGRLAPNLRADCAHRACFSDDFRRSGSTQSSLPPRPVASRRRSHESFDDDGRQQLGVQGRPGRR